MSDGSKNTSPSKRSSRKGSVFVPSFFMRSMAFAVLAMTGLSFAAQIPSAEAMKKPSPGRSQLSLNSHSAQNRNNDELPPVAPPINRAMPQAAPDLRNSEFPNANSGNDFDTTSFRIRTPAPSYTPSQGRMDSERPLTGRARQDRLDGQVRENTGSTLTQVELKRMADRDMVLIIDRSSSMLTHDCPSSSFAQQSGVLSSLLGMSLGPLSGSTMSRWNWVVAQTAELSRQTTGIYDKGITVVLFSSGFSVHENITLNRVPQLFKRTYPMGGTNLAPALGSQIGSYFQRRAAARGNVKPVVIGIVTDGMPNNRHAVRQAIIEATRLMRNPQEITIVFFLIGGMDYAGERFVRGLENTLVRDGAQFPIVRGIQFSQLQQQGLAKAIAQSLQ